jgi:hypothetical protein
MYRTCRHIKPNGLRCESPALRGTNFCYFHSKLHSLGVEPDAKYGPMRLPSPEGPAAILVSIAKINDALINGRIDTKRAGQLLYAMQIASQHLESHRPAQVDQQVEIVVTTPEGDELAPDEYVCGKDEDCNQCPYATADQCTKWHFTSDKKEEEDADSGDDDKDDDADVDEDAVGDDSADNDSGD